jgi:hypothetical protein
MRSRLPGRRPPAGAGGGGAGAAGGGGCGHGTGAHRRQSLSRARHRPGAALAPHARGGVAGGAGLLGRPGGAAGRRRSDRADAAAATGRHGGRAWGWSLLAALAHEVTAAGCVLAAAVAASERTAANRSQGRELDELLRQRDAARQQLAELREQAELRPEGAGSELTAAGSAARGRARELAPLLACPEGCGRSFAGARAVGGNHRHCAARRERLRQRKLGAVSSKKGS